MKFFTFLVFKGGVYTFLIYTLVHYFFKHYFFSSSLNTPYYTHFTTPFYILSHHFAHLSNTFSRHFGYTPFAHLSDTFSRHFGYTFSSFKLKNLAQSTQFIKISPFRIQILVKIPFSYDICKGE